jgi:hypothetical protein
MSQSKGLIVCCSDPRLVVWMDKYIKERGWRPMEVDRLINPGVVPALAWKMSYSERDVYLKNIKLLFDAHHFEEIVLVSHQDCAAIGGSAKYATPELEQKDQEQMLSMAQQNIEKVLAPAKVKIALVYVSREIFDTLNQQWLDAA